MNESIFRSTIKRLFYVMGSVVGALLGIALVVTLLSFWSGKNGDKPSELTSKYLPEIQPNAKNERKVLSGNSPVILKINISGILGVGEVKREKIEEILIESREKTLKDGRVKGIFLTINSPGGTVTDSDTIFRALKAYKKQYNVPIYVYVDGMCASGGMYIACAGDKIYASKSSIIGSVGVIVPTAMNFSKILEKYDIETKTLTAGKGKDALNPLRPWKADEGANYQLLINSFYDIFVEIVTSNRPNLDKEKLIQEYGAHIFPAAQAKEFGYIDEIVERWNEPLAALVQAAGIEDDEYQVFEMQDNNWFASLFQNQKKSPLLTGVIKHQLALPPEIETKLSNRLLYLYTPEIGE